MWLLSNDDLFATRLEPAHSTWCTRGSSSPRWVEATSRWRPTSAAAPRRHDRPGGPDWGSWHFNPPAQAVEKLIALICEAFPAGVMPTPGATILSSFAASASRQTSAPRSWRSPRDIRTCGCPCSSAAVWRRVCCCSSSAEEFERLQQEAEASFKEPGSLGHHVHVPAVLGPDGDIAAGKPRRNLQGTGKVADCGVFKRRHAVLSVALPCLVEPERKVRINVRPASSRRRANFTVAQQDGGGGMPVNVSPLSRGNTCTMPVLHVLRVFCDSAGQFGSPLGVVLDGPAIPPERRSSARRGRTCIHLFRPRLSPSARRRRVRVHG